MTYYERSEFSPDHDKTSMKNLKEPAYAMKTFSLSLPATDIRCANNSGKYVNQNVF